jgi:phage host-nuclease inhibitor protein Gam
MKINSWDDLETKLGAYRRIELTATSLATEADTEIQAIKERLGKALKKNDEEKPELFDAIQDFVQVHREDIAPAKSRELRFGVVGFREEPKFTWPKKNEVLIQRLKELKLKGYVKAVPASEKPDKEGIMAHWKDLDLAKLGVSRTSPEFFFIKIKTESET